MQIHDLKVKQTFSVSRRRSAYSHAEAAASSRGALRISPTMLSVVGVRCGSPVNELDKRCVDSILRWDEQLEKLIFVWDTCVEYVPENAVVGRSHARSNAVCEALAVSCVHGIPTAATTFEHENEDEVCVDLK